MNIGNKSIVKKKKKKTQPPYIKIILGAVNLDFSFKPPPRNGQLHQMEPLCFYHFFFFFFFFLS